MCSLAKRYILTSCRNFRKSSHFPVKGVGVRNSFFIVMFGAATVDDPPPGISVSGLFGFGFGSFGDEGSLSSSVSGTIRFHFGLDEYPSLSESVNTSFSLR